MALMPKRVDKKSDFWLACLRDQWDFQWSPQEKMDDQHSRPPLSTPVSSQRADRALVSPTFSSFSSFLFNWKVWNPELQFVRVSHSSCPNPLHRKSPLWQEELLQCSGLLCKSPLNQTPSGRFLFIGFSSLLLWLRTCSSFFYRFWRKDTWTELFRLALFCSHVNISPTLIPKNKGWGR